MSWTTGFMRRSEPATSTRLTPATVASWSRRDSAMGRAVASGMPEMPVAIRSRARFRFSSVRAPMPGSAAIWPLATALVRSSTLDTPRRSWISRALRGPTPGTRTSTRRPSGTSARSSSRAPTLPRSRYSRTLAAMDLPIPEMAASSLSDSVARSAP